MRMFALPLRVFTVVLIGIAASARSGGAAPEKPKASLPLPQTVNGATMKVLEMGWRPSAEFPNAATARDPKKPPFVFVVSFDVAVKDAPPLDSPLQTLNGYVQAWLVGPDGRRLEGKRVATTERPPPMRRRGDRTPLTEEQQKVLEEYWARQRASTGTRVWNELGLDPQWDNFTLELTWRDARGFEHDPRVLNERLEFKDLPLPSTKEEPLLLKSQQTTPRGIRVTLESAVIKPRRNAPEESTLYIVGRWLPPERDAAFVADVSLSRGAEREGLANFEYDSGPPSTDRTHHVGIETGKIVGKRDETPRYFKIYAPAPPDGTKTVTVRLDIRDKRPQQPDEKWVRRFAFPLRRADIARPPATPTAPAAESAAVPATP